MPDVSSRTWSIFQNAIDGDLVSRDELLEGLDFDHGALRRVAGRISWDVWTALCERLVARVPLDVIATLATDSDVMGPLRTLSASVAAPSDLYTYGVRFVGPLLYRTVDFEITQEGDSVRIRGGVHSGYRGCRAWVDITTTTARHLPRLIGMPPSSMRVDHVDDRSFEILVTPPPSMSFAARIARAWRSLRGGPGLFHELGYFGAEVEATQSELREAEEGMRAAFSALDSYVAVHADGEVLWANPAMEEELGGRPLDSLVVEPDRARFREMLGGGPSSEETFTTPAGRRLEALRSAPFRMRRRNARLLIARDVTERVLARERVAVRDRMASLGTLAAGAAHEINNPLTYVQINLEEGLSTVRALRDPPPDLEPLLDEALDGARRIGGIVAELQQFSRVRGPTLEPIALSGAVTRAAKLAAPALADSIELTTSVPEDLHVSANGEQLVQVLLNLIVNGAEAIAAGAGAGSIQLQTTATGDDVAVEISDDGPGIPPDVLGRVFDPFFTTKERGTGLGLALSQRMVTEWGGAITVGSAREGARFTVRLPRATVPERAVVPRPLRASGGLRVLVVDDEPYVGKALIRMLAGHEVAYVSEGEAALARIGDWDPQFVLCDQNMPGMTGSELLRRLRSRGDARPFALITGGTLDPATERFLAAEGVPVVRKPFTRQEIEGVLEGGRTRALPLASPHARE